jgi:hypothetical protein
MGPPPGIQRRPHATTRVAATSPNLPNALAVAEGVGGDTGVFVYITPIASI